MKRSDLSERAAKLIRRLTDPPFLGTAFALTLGAVRGDLFSGPWERFLLVLFLGILPAPAYILRPSGSRIRRLLPFLVTFASYLSAALWAQFAGLKPELMLVCRTYFFSVALLTWFNLLLHTNASGHVCGIVGPLVLLMYLTGLQLLWFALPVAAAIVWASMYLHIHDWQDVALGCLVFAAAFILSRTLGML